MYQKTCFFMILASLWLCSVHAQRPDSLKTDSLRRRALHVREDSVQTDSGSLDTAKKKKPIKLKTITIRGQKSLIEQRVDGIVFNVESLPAIAGSDASDVLRKVPMVSVDANGGLSIRGSSNIKVLIDGKPSDIYASSIADALRAIRGENIVRVEVITNPSSRYDAEGADAVINIITRKIRDDATNGNVSGVAGNRSESIMGDVHSKRGSFLINGDAFYQKYWNRNGSVLRRRADQLTLIQRNETKQSGDYFFGGASLLYSLDSLNTFDIGYRARRSPNSTTSVAGNYREIQGTQEYLFQRNMESPVKNNGNSYNIGFNGMSADKKNEYSILGMYAPFKGISDYTLEQNGQRLYRENFFSTTTYDDFVIQADYTRSFTDKMKLEAGAKFLAKNAKSESLFDIYDFESGSFQRDALRSNDFTYQNRIYAAYANTTLKIGKWGLSGGLRYEKTELGAVFKKQSVNIPSFDNLVPQLLLNRMINDKTSIKLSYAMKLVRPYISYLNPTVNTSDSLTLQYGNPELEPELTNRYQLSYSVNGAKLFRDFVLFFNDNRNTIENIRRPLGNGIFESTWRNVGKNQRLGMSATFNWKPSSAFSLGTGLTAQYVWLESGTLGISNKGLMRQLTLNGSYKLPKGFSVDFYGFFGAKNLQLQGYRSGWKFYNMTISKKSKDERLNL
ncbi:MAG TPA: TonB-dependent receptor, partial [Pedobacter sp.]|uniref:TonB-dependent receptor domain-containing protein n=1 Tax=Pedobacter sp. TaxID=1411316 RepID=UPI002C8F7BF9